MNAARITSGTAGFASGLILATTANGIGEIFFPARTIMPHHCSPFRTITIGYLLLNCMLDESDFARGANIAIEIATLFFTSLTLFYELDWENGFMKKQFVHDYALKKIGIAVLSGLFISAIGYYAVTPNCRFVLGLFTTFVISLIGYEEIKETNRKKTPFFTNLFSKPTIKVNYDTGWGTELYIKKSGDVQAQKMRCENCREWKWQSTNLSSDSTFSFKFLLKNKNWSNDKWQREPDFVWKHNKEMKDQIYWYEPTFN